jgi:glycosyltransferase involved in cell wall biosynthesis
VKIAITLSAYNEELNIRPVLEDATRYGDIIVVDDGSPDRTVEIAQECGVQVVKHPLNLGQGLAVITGFKAALGADYDVIIEMDADGQHNPAEIPLFLKKLEESGADIVVGSRILGSNYANAPLARRYFLPKLTSVINLLTGYNLTDSMCGFRAFRSASLRRVLPLLDRMLEPQYLAAEMFMRFSREGLTVEEVPINLQDRTSGVSRKGLFRYGWGIGRAILKVLLERRA